MPFDGRRSSGVVVVVVGDSGGRRRGLRWGREEGGSLVATSGAYLRASRVGHSTASEDAVFTQGEMGIVVDGQDESVRSGRGRGGGGRRGIENASGGIVLPGIVLPWLL